MNLLLAFASVLINLLVFIFDVNGASKLNVLGFYHGDHEADHISFVEEANKWFPKVGANHSFTYTSTNDWSQLNEGNLKKYQVVMFLDGQPNNLIEKNAFEKYMENGGGWMGFHVSAFTTNSSKWSWYHTTFLGSGPFVSNTWWPTNATLKTESRNHVATKSLPEKWISSVSEWYSWANDLRNQSHIEILASIDPSSFPLGTDPNQSWYNGYYPVIWSHKKYKMIYCNFGHNLMDYKKNISLSSTFESQIQNQLMIDGLQWLAGIK